MQDGKVMDRKQEIYLRGIKSHLHEEVKMLKNVLDGGLSIAEAIKSSEEITNTLTELLELKKLPCTYFANISGFEDDQFYISPPVG